MSINDFFNKIKRKLNIDKITVLYLLVIIGVGISSFGIGRFSAPKLANVDNGISISYSQPEASIASLNDTSIVVSPAVNSQNEKRYVASKNGKMYYSLGCGGAKRIKSENEVWFKTALDAEKAGYQRSSQCK